LNHLVLRNIYKRYGTRADAPYAVNDLSLEIPKGAFVGILGPSGCGKSTTLRMVAGLEEITAGELEIGGRRCNDTLPKDRGVGLAFEEYALYPPLTVYDNIAFCLRAKKIPKQEVDQRVRAMAAIMKVDELLREKVDGLSGGQKQRVNIARALVRNPEILLLDEPLSHLDQKMRQSLRREIKKLHNEIKCTTILVTHDQMEALSLADYIAVMDRGVLQQFGTPKEIYEEPANVFVADFIGEPPMNLLTVTAKEQREVGKIFEMEDGSHIRMPKGYGDKTEPGQQYIMGIRPTNVQITRENDWDWECRVDVFENLGEERMISISIRDKFFTIVTQEKVRYQKGDRICVKLDPDRVYLFDKDTGKRIGKGEDYGKNLQPKRTGGNCTEP
jgi:multiple sugar transport system ATP-binding protein